MPTWGEHIRRRWPARQVDVQYISEAGVWYDWGHIPGELFARAVNLENGSTYRGHEVRHEYWRARHDLFGEYSYWVEPVAKGAPFAIPVTALGQWL